jgi:hypothetical protein
MPDPGEEDKKNKKNISVPKIRKAILEFQIFIT